MLVLHRGMPKAETHFILLKCDGLIRDLGGEFRQMKIIYLFEFSEVEFLNVSLNEDTMKNIHNHCMAELGGVKYLLFIQCLF